IRFHQKTGCAAALTGVRPLARFGELMVEGDRVVQFIEKPAAEAGWVNGGYFVMTPKIFRYLDGDATILERGPLERMAADGELVLSQAATTVSLGEGKARSIFTFGFDFFPFWYWDRFFTLGHGLADWYGKAANAYPPPHEVLMAPFSYLPRDAAQAVSIVGS